MKVKIAACEAPKQAIHRKYLEEGGYVDCFAVELSGKTSLAAFVEAFYTSWLFKIERAILSIAVSRPSTDAEARELVMGKRKNFAAWSVEQRADNQLLMCDFQSRTRSWFMVENDVETTTLYFGSAIAASPASETGRREIPFVFRVLLGFHKLYSRALLGAAVRSLPH